MADYVELRNRLHDKYPTWLPGRTLLYCRDVFKRRPTGRIAVTRTRAELDVAVVGAGPIGLECAVRLRQAGLRVLVVDRGAVGQTMTWFPRQMHFFSSNDRIGIAGVPLQTLDQQKATREEYLSYLRQVVGIHDLDVRTFEPVTAIARDGDRFQVTTAPAGGERTYHPRHVVLAVGDMDRPRELGIPGEDLPHVSHYFEEPHRYFGRRLLVVGGKNSAVEAALRCYHAGAKVAISYRRPEFKASSVKYWLLPELEGRLRRGQITGHLGTVPVAIDPDAVTLEPAGGGERFTVPAEDVLLLTGYVGDTTLLRAAGVEVEGPEGVPVFDPDTMETNVPGLYVAGTVTAGTQSSFMVFIENCHVHAERIVAHLTAAPTPRAGEPYERPEA
jgi:thioredoxin reductase (NADPH)